MRFHMCKNFKVLIIARRVNILNMCERINTFGARYYNILYLRDNLANNACEKKIVSD